MSGRYERLRTSLTDPETTAKGTERLFVLLATQEDGLTAAVVTMAALDTPAERAAALVDRELPELDAIVMLFDAWMGRWLAAEREARGDAA